MRTVNLIRRLKNRINDYRFVHFVQPELPEQSAPKTENEKYEKWISIVEDCYEKTDASAFSYRPKISVLVPVYNVLDKHLVPCIESVLSQEYDNWELCLADDCSTWDSVRATLDKYKDNPKIKVIYREKNGHISEATNTALEHSTGEYITFLDCDDVLSVNALSEVVKLLNENPELDFIYSDEDKIDDDGLNRHMPHFKSDWAPDTLMAHMYTCHLGVYRRSIAVEIGGDRKGYEGAQDYDFTLRFTEKTDKIAHIPKILYHWRERAESTAGNEEAKPYVLEASRKCREDALARRGLKGRLEMIEGTSQYRVNYIWDEYPKVSIIIPSKDNYDILKKCLESLTSITEYEDYEVIVVDNGSNEENKAKYRELTSKHNAVYLYDKKTFNFSYMCNYGVKHSNGEYLLFLNDDIEILSPDWLTRMIGQAMLPHTGAVGAKLLYPDGRTIQHVGVINLECGPGHLFTGYDDSIFYYFYVNAMNYNRIAVTGACLAVKRSKFDEVGGFDEELAVAYNDVDLCMKLYEAGYYNSVRNDAVLIHHESVSRGNDVLDPEKLKRLTKERYALYDRHPQINNTDPFYNPNLAQLEIDYSNNYNAFPEVVSKVSPAGEIREKDKNVHSVIDGVKQDKNFIHVYGWIYICDDVYSSLRDVYLLLSDEDGKCCSCSVEKVLRPDVDEAAGGRGWYKQSGFDCVIRKKDLKENTKYRIGLQIKDRFVLTERYIEI